MLRSKARWHVHDIDEQAAERLAQALGIDPVLSRLLAARGITDVNSAERFLDGSTSDCYDPFLMDGMDTAVHRINTAIHNGEKIRIYGDYDADGVSATALMTHLLRRLGAVFDYYIPHRVSEGYGLNIPAVELAKKQGVSLIITVDNGISAVEQIDHAAKIGVDVIVTDHHEPPAVLPRAHVCINPRKPGCPYPFKQLAGAGVAFKLAEAMLGEFPESLAEFATIGTVADLMPLVDENRIIVKAGIERMRHSSCTGIAALMRASGIDAHKLNAGHIGFGLAPRINAGGRLASADGAVRLLTTHDELEAEQLAAGLDGLNKDRQKIVETITEEAVSLLIDEGNENDRVIVLAKPNWNVGVVGIVASKIQETWYRPSIILSIDPETGLAKGSARSIAGFDIYEALSSCADLMEHFGGHQAAAGLTIKAELLPVLSERLNQFAEKRLTDADLVPTLTADMVFTSEEVSLELCAALEKLQPFGAGNASPRFMLEGLRIGDAKTVGREQQHLKLSFHGRLGEPAALDAIAFGYGRTLAAMSPHARMDVVGELAINEWNGVRKPQIIVQDMRIPHVQVIDLRGARDAVRRIADLADQAGRIRGMKADASFAVLLRDGASIAALPEILKNPPFSLWTMNRHGAQPMLPGDGPPAFDRITDLILLSLPTGTETLPYALQQAASVERIYAIFDAGEEETREWAAGPPTRETFKRVYASLIGEDPNDAALRSVHYISKRTGLSERTVAFILSVFEELELVENKLDQFKRAAVTNKTELTESSRYRQAMQRYEAEQTFVYSTSEQLTDWVTGHLYMNSRQEDVI